MRTLLLVALCFGVLSEIAAAQSPRVEVFPFAGSEDIEEGYAVLIRQVGDSLPLVERRPGEVTRTGNRRWEGRLKLSEEDLQQVQQVVFFGRTADGKVLISEVRALSAARGAETPSAVVCNSDPTIFDAGVLTKFSQDEIKVFLDVKKQRTRILADRARQLMTPNTVRRLNELEREYGLTASQPIRIGMPYEELVQRLGRVQAVGR